MTTADDAALVQQCLAGDTSAFDVLVERHRRQVYQVCYRFEIGRASCRERV